VAASTRLETSWEVIVRSSATSITGDSCSRRRLGAWAVAQTWSLGVKRQFTLSGRFCSSRCSLAASLDRRVPRDWCALLRFRRGRLERLAQRYYISPPPPPRRSHGRSVSLHGVAPRLADRGAGRLRRGHRPRVSAMISLSRTTAGVHVVARSHCHCLVILGRSMVSQRPPFSLVTSPPCSAKSPTASTLALLVYLDRCFELATLPSIGKSAP